MRIRGSIFAAVVCLTLSATAAPALALTDGQPAPDTTTAVSSTDVAAVDSTAATDSSAATTTTSALTTTTTWTGPDPTLAPAATTWTNEDARWLSDTSPNALSGGDGPCAGQTRGHVVKTYLRVAQLGSLPLRCGRWDGSSGWGFRKLKALGRWNTWYDGMIGATLQSPASVSADGSSRTYVTQWFTQCRPVYRFRVVTETRTYGSGEMGVLNAYQETR